LQITKEEIQTDSRTSEYDDTNLIEVLNTCFEDADQQAQRAFGDAKDLPEDRDAIIVV
jgi:hypothetical protein